MSIAVFTKSGTKSQTKLSLPKTIFGTSVTNHELLKQAYLAGESNSRTNVARTKTRGEIRGGGKKPWRQKGTGRARFGSSRNPIWRGGGIVFGPRGNENYAIKLSQTAKQTALKQALSLAVQDDRLSVIDEITLSGKTKDANSLLAKLGMPRVLVVVDQITPKQRLSLSNLPNVDLLGVDQLNAYHVLQTPHLLMSKAAIDAIVNRLEAKS